MVGVALSVIGVILLFLSFVPSYTILPNLSYWDSTNSVGQNGTKKVGIGFIPKDNLLVAKVTVYSNSPKVAFSIMDSQGKTVFAPVLIYESYGFVFKAPKDDSYYFYFNNTSSTIGNSSVYRKTVLWKIYYYGNYALIFQTLGLMPIVGGILCFIEYFLYPFKTRTIDISVEIYQNLLKKARTEGKTVEEIIEETITKREKQKTKGKNQQGRTRKA
ncbi:MAG: hypothetical protein ACE5NN_02195 [Candidatus Bathyarchaeia archaeon]